MPFPVVGIGASAGGLEAFSELLANLPANTGMAFLLVQHLDPTHGSFLVEILAKKTGMPIEEAREGTEVSPDHVYVLPPNSTLTLAGDRLHLATRETIEQRRSPVDILFESLAERGPNAIGVILSGTGSDGAKGVQVLKDAGCIIFAQEESSARFSGMPNSAIQTGCVDFILSPRLIAHELVRMGGHSYLNGVAASPSGPEELEATAPPHLENEEQFKRVFRILRNSCGVDFAHYKCTTIQRRLSRRMAVHQIESLATYVNLLQENPAESQALFRDLLICVTSFFRDQEMFQALEENIFPTLLEHKNARTPLRIWVPGCASGEEVYSIAICLYERLADQASNRSIQIFGTDLNDAAIEQARAGYYLENISADVSAERLQRFFTKTDDHYQIARSIRDLCVFAKHNLIRDPPFSRLDLISCRNLLIYLDQSLHRRALSLFHYALKPRGFLVLGPSETVGQSPEFFEHLDDRHRIYIRKDTPDRAAIKLDTGESVAQRDLGLTATKTVSDQFDLDRMSKESDRLLLTRYAPACVLVDEDLNILQFRGETSLYLEHLPGLASLNLQKLARPTLLVALSTAIAQARKEEAPVSREGITVKAQGETREIGLEVIPIRVPESNAPGFLILFEDSPHQTSGQKRRMWLEDLFDKLLGKDRTSATRSEREREFLKVKQELDAARGFLQATIEEQEAAKEELKSAHEELLSANEEFQTTNEELETAKEELQATNEELVTTNDELRNRNRELNRANAALQVSRDYAEAIIATVREPLLILNKELGVVRANRAFYEFFKAPPEEIENKALQEIGEHQWNDSSLRALLDKAVSQNESFSDFEMVKVFPSIGEKALLLHGHRLPFDEKRGELCLLGIDDITDRRALEEARRTEREHFIEEQASDIRVLVERDHILKAADQHKNEFLAMLAHELRNPLAPIRTTLDVLRRSGTDATLEWGWNIIDRQTRHLTRLVDDLLDVARLTRGEIFLRKEIISLLEVLNHSVETSRPAVEARKQTLKLQLPREPLCVDGDLVRLAQVFSNLLNNASKYSPEGSEIALAAESIGPEAMVIVSDHGIGIPADVLPHIFEVFAQADRSKARSQGGLGLGLTLSRRLVELHGGNISATSEGPGMGTQMVVRLPVSSNAPPSENASVDLVDERRTESSKFRILVVDDNVDSAESIVKLLHLHGHDARCAFNGASALTIARQFEADLVLLDISLPDIDGYEVLRRLREQPHASRPVVAAVTGFGQPEDRRRTQEAGFDHHLVKPFGPDVLVAMLQSLGQP